jgi:hypothetical protein
MGDGSGGWRMSTLSITIRWNGDEAVVKYSDVFEQADNLLKADMLKDAIYELKEKYELIIEEGIIHAI